MDYKPLSPWEGKGEADARSDRVPPADSLTLPWHGEQGSAAQMATLPQAAHSAARQEHRPIKCEPITAGSRQGDYPDPYGDGQLLPKAPRRRQLTKQILAELNSSAPDAIQGEADGFPYHGSIRARNALFLDTELRSGSAMVGLWSAGSCWRRRGLRLQIGKCSRWPEGQNWVATAICIQQVEARCLES